jgi:hypothetical protein
MLNVFERELFSFSDSARKQFALYKLYHQYDLYAHALWNRYPSLPFLAMRWRKSFCHHSPVNQCTTPPLMANKAHIDCIERKLVSHETIGIL